MVNNDFEELHFSLYDFLIRHEMIEELHSLKTPFVAQFLDKTIKDQTLQGDAKKRDPTLA